MTFNILYGSLNKARKGSRVFYHSPVSTTGVPEELLKGRYEFFHVIPPSDGKCQTTCGHRPYSTGSFQERHVHTSGSIFCSKDKETDEDEASRKIKRASSENKELKANQSKSNLVKKRSFYKIRHQNLVWNVSNNQNKTNKSKMSAPISEINKELPEKKLNNTLSDIENSKSMSDKENKMVKTEDSSTKNVLTIDVFSDTSSAVTPHISEFRTSEGNINRSSKIDSKTRSAIDNSDKSISLKGAIVENSKNNNKTVNNNALITKSTIEESKKANLIPFNQNKISINGRVLEKKYEPFKKIKNIKDKDKLISLYNKDHSMNVFVKSKKMNLKVTNNSHQNKNRIEIIEGIDSKSINSNRSKLAIFENQDDLDNRQNISANEGKGTIWETAYRQNISRMLTNELQYHINLKSKIQHNYNNINLSQRYKVAASINSILRPVKSKAQIENERYDSELLPKSVNIPTVPSVNSIQSIPQQVGRPSNFVMDNTLYLKSVKNGKYRLDEPMLIPNKYISPLNVFKNKPHNKNQLIKDINAANLKKKDMVNGLKYEIKSWKKYEHVKNLVLKSTSEIYQSIMNGRKIGKLRKNTIYNSRKKTPQKCSIVSIPLMPNLDVKKYRNSMQMKKYRPKHNSRLTSKPDPIKILNDKYKQNYHNTFNDLLKKNEILIYQEKFKRNAEILESNLKKEFLSEKESGVMDNTDIEFLNSNKFKKPEEKDMKVFMKNVKKISLGNKSPWVRYMHQMNDESKKKSSIATEIRTYPSGCLKKPELIIEFLLVGECDAEMAKLTQFNITDSQTDKGSLNTIIEENKPQPLKGINNVFNKQDENSMSNIIAEQTSKININKIDEGLKDKKFNIAKFETGMEKPISFSDLCKFKSCSQSKHTESQKKYIVPEEKHLTNITHYALNSLLLDKERLSVESLEDPEPEVGNSSPNELNNESSIEKVKEVFDVSSSKHPKVNNSEKFKRKKNVNNKLLNKINNDCDSANLNKTLSTDAKTFPLKEDYHFPTNNLSTDDKSFLIKEEYQFPTNKIKVEVSSNIIYENPTGNTKNSQELPRGHEIAEDYKQYTINTIIPSKNNSFVKNQPLFMTTNSSKQIKPMPVKPSSQQLHAIEILINSSQSQPKVSEESKKYQENQKEYLTETTSSKPGSKSNVDITNSGDNQHLNFCHNSNVNEYQTVNTLYNSKQFPKVVNFKNSNSVQNFNNLYNNLGNVNSIPNNTLSEDITVSNGSNTKGLPYQVNPPLIILPSNEKKTKKIDLATGQETQKTIAESGLQTSQRNQNVEETKNFQKLNPLTQSDSYKVENINADINQFKLFNFFKKSYPEISHSKDSIKDVFIDNIKGLFRTSCNYFKLYNTESGVTKVKTLSNSHHSKTKHATNQNISNSFTDINLSPNQSVSFCKSNDQSYTSSGCNQPDLHQKWINQNTGRNKITLLPSLIPKHGKEDTNLQENEEFKSRFSNVMLYSKDDIPSTSKEFEHLIPNKEISINDLETGMKTKKLFRKNSMPKTDNILAKNNHHSSFLNKVIDKDFENSSVNQVKQQRSFCNLNHKKSYMKISLKKKLHNQKQKLAKLNAISKENKDIQYSMNSDVSINKTPNLEESRGKRESEIIPFKCKIGLEPNMANITELKKCHSYPDVMMKPKMTEKLNLRSNLTSFQKSTETNNPESYWFNCLSKNIYAEDKMSSNEFISYIKRRKVTTKSFFKSIK
ncbi:uncharacterized protein PF3D7_1120600 [Halyomorpha halys]|uniref:uncharacterized protein PF3D7_1120600 n=1 Tax=Halyomorpha halys TaxID=286706 RepID=UPI0034D19D09